MRNANPIKSVECTAFEPVRFVGGVSQASRPSEAPYAARDLTLAYDEIIARHARTSFSFASRFLPSEKRESTIILYAFFRTLDDLVDLSDRGIERGAVRAELRSWRAWIRNSNALAAPRETLARDLMQTIDRHTIPIDPFEHFLEGLEFDLDDGEILDDHDLERYCYQVASTVGIVMSYTLGARHDDALVAAARLAAAMQLTNILRDIGEDLEAGRVYIPTDTLEAFGLTVESLEAMMEGPGPDAAFRAMMADQIRVARAWYQEGLAGVWELPQDCRFPILVASHMYRQLLFKIEARNYDTLRNRVRTTRFGKLREAVRSYALVQLRRSGS